MKVNLRIVILLLVCISLYAKADPYNLPTAEQVSKLAAAVWKEPVHSIDVTLYKEITKPPKSLEEIRAMFKRVFEKTDGPKENLSGWKLESFNRNVQLNVERAVKEQEAGRRMKQRIRIDGYRQRTDQVIGYSKMVLLEGTPHERTRPEVVLGPNTPYDMSLVNLGDKRKGDYTSFTYYHMNKSARITNKRGSRWQRSDVIEFAELASFFKGFLGVNKGSIAEPVFVPDPNKIQQLRKTGLVAGKLRLTIKPDPNKPDARDRIELKSDDCLCGTVFICDRQDYSRVYYMEACSPITAKPLYVRECSNFDDRGFPRNVTEIKYDRDGNFEEMSVYKIVKVELNPSMPDEVFKFQPPEDYEVDDRRPPEKRPKNVNYLRTEDVRKTLRQVHNAFEERDLTTLKEFLKHKFWRVRSSALGLITGVAEGEELKKIVESMRKDKKDEVREQAERILKGLQK